MSVISFMPLLPQVRFRLEPACLLRIRESVRHGIPLATPTAVHTLGVARRIEDFRFRRKLRSPAVVRAEGQGGELSSELRSKFSCDERESQCQCRPNSAEMLST